MTRQEEIQALLDGILVTQTLMSNDPDCNRRVVLHGHQVVRVFNADMQPWTPEMERELVEFVAALKNGSPQ